jgi:hypothetical protein
VTRSSAAVVLKLPSQKPVLLDDGPATIALVQREIFRDGRTYLQLADAAGISPTTVMHIAHGDTKRPAMRTCMLILVALGWEVWASERSR